MPAPGALSGLPPRQARLCLKVEAFARSLLPGGFDGGPLVLALSGGVDSTALALILKALAPRLGLTLVAAHLDHGLRPESAREATACQALCRDLGIECACCRQDVAELAASWGTGLEDAGRRARYAWLEEIRSRHGGFAVATAHHLDDLAEDQLLRLMRGTGWPALGGMPAWDPKRRILRPLLLTPKADLSDLLRATGTPWREDPSNSDPRFTRNRVRGHILPLLVRENPDYLQAAAELWRQARIDADHWDQAVEAVMTGCGGQAPAKAETPFPGFDPGTAALPPAGLRHASEQVSEAQPPAFQEDAKASLAFPLPGQGLFLAKSALAVSSRALRLRLYKRAVEALGPGQPLSATLHRLDAAWLARSTGKRFQFPGGKEARIEGGGIAFHPGQPASGVDTFPPEG